jgi:hypothetical protein
MASKAFLSFSGRNAKTWNNIPLYYYRPGTSFDLSENPLDFDGMLASATKSGECTAWQDLFTQCLSVNGLVGINVKARPTSAADEAFLVKDWIKDPPTQAWPYAWRIALAPPGDMVPVPAGADYGDLKSSTTLQGQNSGAASPSEKVFGAHFFIKFGSTYFDPSYGVTYTSTNDFVSKAVFGFGGNGANNGVTVTYDVRDPVAQNGISFDEY